MLGFLPIKRTFYNTFIRHSGRRDCVKKSKKCYQSRHAGENRHPEPTEITGFRVALRLHGMTNKQL
jgi:hypothetical protein